MNYKEFQKSSKRTLANLASKKEDLAHMVMGICSEISELEEAISKNDRNGIGEELADIQWYISNYNNIIGTEYVGNDTVSSDNIEMLIKLLYSQCSLLQDLVKKYLAYNKKINSKTTLVVNSFYDKNTDLKDMVINYESYEEILEAIDEFMNIFNMKTCYILQAHNNGLLLLFL